MCWQLKLLTPMFRTFLASTRDSIAFHVTMMSFGTKTISLLRLDHSGGCFFVNGNIFHANREVD